MYLASRIGVSNPILGTPWYNEHREFYITPYICTTNNLDGIPVLACNLDIPAENICNLELTYRRKVRRDRLRRCIDYVFSSKLLASCNEAMTKHFSLLEELLQHWVNNWHGGSEAWSKPFLLLFRSLDILFKQ